MPIQSRAQAAYLGIHHPELLRKWQKESPREIKKLPKRRRVIEAFILPIIFRAKRFLSEADLPSEGYWITVNGHHVFIKRKSEAESAQPTLSVPHDTAHGEPHLPSYLQSLALGKHASTFDKARLLEKRSLRRAPIVKTKHLGQGIMGAMKVTLDDGTEGVLKLKKNEQTARSGIEKGTYYHREVAAAEVAEVLGMADLVPPTVVKQLESGDIGSCQKWVNGELECAGDTGRHPSDLDPSLLARAAAYDYLIGNTDRHANNWKINEDGDRIALIDNHLSFPTSISYDGLRSGLVVRVQRDEDELSSATEGWRGQWTKIESVLQHNKIEKEAIQQTKSRFNELTSKKSFSDLSVKAWE